MDLNLLKTFDAVMKTRSVNEAADSLDVSPPAVSHALNRLREHYQDPLFIRQGRGIAPTNFAIELHAQIQEPLSLLLNGARSRQSFTPHNSQRTFRISSHKDIDLMIIPPLIEYRDQHAPQVKLVANVEHLDEKNRHADLRMRRVDLILATVPMEEHGYHNHKLFEFPLVAVCQANHPRIQGSLSEEQFFSERHLLWDTRRLNRNVLDSLAETKLPEREVTYATGSICNAIMLAAQTDWLCVTSEWHAKLLSKQHPLQILPLPFKCQPLPVYMTWHHSQQTDTGHQWLKSALEDITRPFNRPE